MGENKDTSIIISIGIVCVVVFGAIFFFMSKSTPQTEDELSNKTNKETTMNQSVKEKGIAFLKENGSRQGVVTTASGLQYEIITAGTGPKPTSSQTVKVHYEGTLVDGTVFDSSYQRGEPIEFGVTQVIPGWVEGLQLMPVGSKWKLFIPSDLAYGTRGAGGLIGPDETLIFTVELLGVR